MDSTIPTAAADYRQVGELLVAFALSSVVGVERQFRGKSAGLRTHAIVGTSAALIMLVSKYGFGDVLVRQAVVVDPSRVAAQIVSGVGFLGAGIIITRRGTIRGLTTAASVWETSAIGMAAGAGLILLALVVTVLHFVTAIGYGPLSHAISSRGKAEYDFTITYDDGRGVLRTLLSACSAKGWTVTSMSMEHPPSSRKAATSDDHERTVAVALTLSGIGTANAQSTLAPLDGVIRVERGTDDDE